MMDVLPENTGEKQDGRFIKGQSGNPNGRPKGALNNTTKMAMALLDSQVEAITQKVIDLALAGDMQAIKLIFERTIPARKERPINIDLTVLNGIDDIINANDKIITGVANGDITPAEGQKLIAFVEDMKKTIKNNTIDKTFGNWW
jgi:hypothetical protein